MGPTPNDVDGNSEAFIFTTGYPRTGSVATRAAILPRQRKRNPRRDRIGTQPIDGTGRAIRLPGQADPPTVGLEQMAEPDLFLIGYQGIQVKLNLIRVRLGTEPQTLREASHVGVHADRRLAIGVAPQDVGRLPAHPWQGQEILECPRDLALEPGDDLLTTLLNGFGLVPVKARGADLFLEDGPVRTGPVLRRSILSKETRRDLVHALIGTLCCQDQRD